MIDFAEQQDRARRRTALLLWIYLLAASIISVLVSLLIWGFVWVGGNMAGLGGKSGDVEEVHAFAGKVEQWIRFDAHGRAFLAICVAITMVMIVGSSWWKYLQIVAGGQAVAESMRGQLIPTNSRDPDERRVLNVVEEMALAANIPVPPVYLMPRQRGINAFAAGRSTEDAVVGITEGAMKRLTRDQLQGVVGHEFSHILNGDMKLDLRLIALLHGLLAVCVLGRVLCDIAMGTDSDGEAIFGSESRKGVLALFPLGILLMGIGYSGWIIGCFIQACVSRQREFLADASAVEFTRNPQGITDALRAIGGASPTGGSAVRGTSLDGYRHMFFASSVMWAEGVLSTHPPLDDRIKRLDAHWDGSYLTPPSIIMDDPSTSTDAFNARSKWFRGVVGGVTAASAIGSGPTSPQMPASMPVQGVTGGIERSRGLLMRLPEQIGDALREPYEARLALFAILLGARGKGTTAEVAALTARLKDDEVKQTLVFARLLAGVPAVARFARLPMVQVALSSLSSLSPEQLTRFREDIRLLVDADGRIDLDEWLLVLMLDQQLSARMGNPPTPREMRPLRTLSRQCSVVIWTLAFAGQKETRLAQHAAQLGFEQLMLGGLPSLEPTDLKRAEMESALRVLAATPANVRAKIMSACAAVIGADGQVTDRESDLLQFLSQMLHTPLPETASVPH